MDLYYYFFFICLIIALFSRINKEATCFILGVVLILFAGTRLEIDRDYVMYENFFHFLAGRNFSYFKKEYSTLELSMYIVPNIYKFFFYKYSDVVHYSMLTFAAIAVSLKMTSIYKYANFFVLSFAFYFSGLYLMHELVTIRAGVGAGIFLLSINDIEKRNTKGFLIKSGIALLFHYSSLLFVGCYFVLFYIDKIKYYYYGIIVSFLVVITKLNILKILFLDKVFPKIDIYLKVKEYNEEKVNIFNFKIIFSIFILIVMGYFYEKLSEIKYFKILFKIHILSLIIFWMFSPTAMVFSIRSFEMISVVQILLAPMILYVFSEKFRVIGVLLISVFIIIQLYYTISIAEIFKPYKSWILVGM